MPTAPNNKRRRDDVENDQYSYDASKRVRIDTPLDSSTIPAPLIDSTNIPQQQSPRVSKKRGRPVDWEEATPKHKNARVALFSILGEAGMLAPTTEPHQNVPMLSLDGAAANPHQIVQCKPDAQALVNGSNNPQHLERLACLMANPSLIKDLYTEFFHRLVKPVDITKAWLYFVSELSHYIHSQCKNAGRKDVTYEQIEDFIKANWFSITQANSLALTGQPYQEIFPAAADGAIVLKNRDGEGASPSKGGSQPSSRFEDMDVDM